MTGQSKCAIVYDVDKFIFLYFLLFRVMEIHRICEVTATPETEGAYLSEQSNNKGI